MKRKPESQKKKQPSCRHKRKGQQYHYTDSEDSDDTNCECYWCNVDVNNQSFYVQENGNMDNIEPGSEIQAEDKNETSANPDTETKEDSRSFSQNGTVPNHTDRDSNNNLICPSMSSVSSETPNYPTEREDVSKPEQLLDPDPEPQTSRSFEQEPEQSNTPSQSQPETNTLKLSEDQKDGNKEDDVEDEICDEIDKETQNEDVETEILTREAENAKPKSTDDVEEDRKNSLKEAKASFPDSIYEPFARKNIKHKNSLIIYNHAGYEPDVRSASASILNRSQSDSMFRTLSRENSQPIAAQVRSRKVSRASDEDKLVSRRHPSLTKSQDSNLGGEVKPTDSQNFSEGCRYREKKSSLRVEQYNQPITLPKAVNESTASATLSNHFFDGSSVSQSEFSSSNVNKTTMLPSLKSNANLSNKKSRHISGTESALGITLPSLTTHRMGTNEVISVARGILRGDVEVEQIPDEPPTQEASKPETTRVNETHSEAPQATTKREINTIRGPHPKWLMNNRHTNQGKAPIISECLPVEDRLINRQKVMARTKQFQNPLSNRLNMVPGLVEKDNSSFHEIRIKLDRIENKIGHIIRNTSHVSRTFDRPNSDSWVEAPKQVLVPEGSSSFLHQQSTIISNQRAYFQFKENPINRMYDPYTDDKKLRVVNLVLNDSELSATSANLPNIFDPHTSYLLDEKGGQSLTHLQPVIPVRKPVFGRSFQEFGASQGLSNSTQKMHSRSDNITRSFKASTAHVFPKPLMKERPKVTKSLSMKVSYQNKRRTLPNFNRQDDMVERISNNSSEGNRTIDETIMLRTGGEIAPW